MTNLRTPFALVALSALGAGLQGCREAQAQSEPQTPQSALELTVYKDDFALVHDQRKVDLHSGSNQMRLPGVSQQLDPNSVLFDWPSKGDHPEVVSTTYNLGVSSSHELLKRLVGQKVDMVWRGQDGKIGDRETGVLEEAGQGTVLHTQDSYLVDPNGEVVASAKQEVPTMPQLVATVQAHSEYASNVSLSYLTRGMSWTADYVGKISPDGKKMRLECWGTITNATGTDFPAAKLNLVAGNPNRAVLNGGGVDAQVLRLQSNVAQPQANGRNFDFGGGAAAPKAVGDLYTYKLSGQSDVMRQQMNRAKILSATDVPVNRTYSIALQNDFGPDIRQSAQVAIAFTNSAKSGLGEPLPSGALRAYEADGSSETYTGAAEIGDTPKDAHVYLTLSDAFDVYAKPKVVAVKKLGKHSWSKTVSVEIHNEKKTDENVDITDWVGAPSNVLSQSVQGAKLAEGTYKWTVPVKAGGRTTLTFTVKTGA